MKVVRCKFFLILCLLIQTSIYELHAQLTILNGSSVTFCEGDSVILRTNAGFTDYRWFIEFDTTALSTGDTLLLDTVPSLGFFYFVTARNSLNIVERDSIFIRQFSLPRFTLGPDLFLCSGDVATLTQPNPADISGTGPISRLWSDGSNLTSIIASNPGTYWLRITRTVVTLSCSFTDTIQVISTTGPLISPIPDTSICFGSSVNLNAAVLSGSPPYQFSWTPTGGLNNPTVANPVASPTATNTYRVIVRDASILQCNSDTAFVTINVSPPINVIVTPQNPSVCPDSVFNLSANASGGAAPFTYTWSPAAGLNTTQGQTVSLTAQSTRTYTVTAEDSVGCTANANTNVTVNTLSVSISQPDSILCEGVDYQLNAVVTGGLPPYNFLWNQGTDRLSSTTIANPIARPGVLTTPLPFVVRVQDQANCRKFDTVILGTRPIPIVIASPRLDSVRIFNSIDFSASASGGAGGPYIYEWSPVNINVINVNSPVLTFTGSIATLGNTDYFVIAIDSIGCSSLRDTITVFTFALPEDSVNVQDRNVIFVPKYFRPNSTNANNTSLRVFGTNISDEGFVMTIYNRWGQVIYESFNLLESQENGWNGSINNSGSELPQGAYTYTIRGKFNDGSTIDLVGSAMLYR